MKKLLTLTCVIGICNLLLSTQPPIDSTSLTPSKISKVIVYSNGAQVTSVLDTKGKTGLTELVLADLPLDVNPKSIVIEANGDIEIISFNSGIEYKIEKVTEDPEVEMLRQQIAVYQDSIDFAQCGVTALMSEKNVIEENDNLDNSDGTTDIDAVIKASEFYRVRMKEIAIELLTIKKRISKLTHAIHMLSSDIVNIDARYLEQDYRINIKVNIKRNTDDGIRVMYYTQNARWYPYYDMKVNGLDKDISLLRKAYISQNTGQDWNDVKVTLSNADPTLNNILPSIQPYNLTDRMPHKISGVGAKSVSGLVFDEEGIPLIGANVIVKGTTHGTVTDIDGSYFLANAMNKNLVVSFTGYTTEMFLASRQYMEVALSPNSRLIEEVAVVGYRDGLMHDIESAYSGYSKRQKIEKVRRQPVRQVKLESINSVEYAIEKPYTILSDNKEIDILLDEESIPAVFEYYAVPLKKENAYLIAKIPEWHKLDMLSGKANLFLKNTYKGSTYINSKSTEDTIRISLGIDPEVIVSRKQLKDKYDKKFFGKNAEESLSYEISVKNNKSNDITIEILDQIPVASHDDIKIELLEKSGASINEDTGILSWKKSMASGSQENLSFSYKVKYPNDMMVTVK